LRFVEDELDIAVFFKSELPDFCGGIDEAAEDKFTLYSLRVVPRTTGRCGGADEL